MVGESTSRTDEIATVNRVGNAHQLLPKQELSSSDFVKQEATGRSQQDRQHLAAGSRDRTNSNYNARPLAQSPSTHAQDNAGGSPPVQVNQAPFIQKLYSMLEDHKLHEYISWSSTDDSFFLNPGEEFSKILCLYFKHTNIASFVRQLSMYGFHKISQHSRESSRYRSRLQNGNSNTQTSAIIPSNYNWEFKHIDGLFRRSEFGDIRSIKRRSSRRASRDRKIERQVMVPVPPHPDNHPPAQAPHPQEHLKQQSQHPPSHSRQPQQNQERWLMISPVPGGAPAPLVNGSPYDHTQALGSQPLGSQPLGSQPLGSQPLPSQPLTSHHPGLVSVPAHSTFVAPQPQYPMKHVPTPPTLQLAGPAVPRSSTHTPYSAPSDHRESPEQKPVMFHPPPSHAVLPPHSVPAPTQLPPHHSIASALPQPALPPPLPQPAPPPTSAVNKWIQQRSHKYLVYPEMRGHTAFANGSAQTTQQKPQLPDPIQTVALKELSNRVLEKQRQLEDDIFAMQQNLSGLSQSAGELGVLVQLLTSAGRNENAQTSGTHTGNSLNGTPAPVNGLSRQNSAGVERPALQSQSASCTPPSYYGQPDPATANSTSQYHHHHPLSSINILGQAAVDYSNRQNGSSLSTGAPMSSYNPQLGITPQVKRESDQGDSNGDSNGDTNGDSNEDNMMDDDDMNSNSVKPHKEECRSNSAESSDSQSSSSMTSRETRESATEPSDSTGQSLKRPRSADNNFHNKSGKTSGKMSPTLTPLKGIDRVHLKSLLN